MRICNPDCSPVAINRCNATQNKCPRAASPLRLHWGKKHLMIPPFSKVFIFIVCFASFALADDFKTIDGKEYKNVKVSRVEPDGIVVSSKSGISKVYFTELPKEVQEHFHYDAAKATAYSTERTANQQEFRKQQDELQRKLTEEKNE